MNDHIKVGQEPFNPKSLISFCKSLEEFKRHCERFYSERLKELSSGYFPLENQRKGFLL
jgi:hypothetical protein